MKIFAAKRNAWIFIVFLVIVFSIPGIVKIYNIRDLFLSSETRDNAVKANIALKKVHGLGATDLRLKKTVKTPAEDVFYFEFSYHHPEKSLSSIKKFFRLEFKDGELISLEEI